eukprot:7112419-Alexandrium_andersonii.AAC.1
MLPIALICASPILIVMRVGCDLVCVGTAQLQHPTMASLNLKRPPLSNGAPAGLLPACSRPANDAKQQM